MAGARLLVLSLLISLLAGCASGTDQEPQATTSDPYLIQVHRDGQPLPLAAYPGDLPRVDQVYVANASSLEPTLGVSPSGAIFYAAVGRDAFDGAATNPRTEVYRSQDQGTTWDIVTPRVADHSVAPITFDPYLHVDPVTGRVFNIDLYVGCHWLSWSDDDGETWETNPLACGLPVNDHQTLFTGPAVVPTVGYDRIVYLCVNQFAPHAQCSRSLDGGRTFLAPSEPLFPRAEAPPDPEAYCEGEHSTPYKRPTGHGAASEVDGTIYVPMGYCARSWLAVSGDAGLTWDVVLVDDTTGIHPEPVAFHEASVAVDEAGTVYYMWLAADGRPHLATSGDGGRSWSDPMQIGRPEVTAAKFPAITAGAAGRIAFVYLGTTATGGLEAAPEDKSTASWHAYVGFSMDADAAAPVFATTPAGPYSDPVRRGPCEARCGDGADSVYDFIDIQNDPVTGGVYAALVDVCTGTCPYDDEPVAKSRAAVAVQVGGTLLRDKD